MFLGAYPGHSPLYGYSCQTWLARQVNEFLHPERYYCWFAAHFNAVANGDSANPMWLYLTLDRAVEQGDINNAKVKDVRMNLLFAAVRELRKGGRSKDIPGAITAIAQAPIRMFTSQLWRLKMDAVAGRYTRGDQYPDEYKIEDLKSQEFDVIID